MIDTLCPTDLSEASRRPLTYAAALARALALARQADGAVTVLHAIEWLTEEEPREHAHFNVPEYRQHLIDDARHRVQALMASESSGVRFTMSSCSGGPIARFFASRATCSPI